jgi:outer membrane protein OmpA-like peptidoglycan-associated protein
MQRAQEPVVQPTDDAPDPAVRLVSEKRIVHHSPGGRLALAGLLLPALVAGGAVQLAGSDAETSLVSEATGALRSDGLTGVRLEADGPFVTAHVPTRVDAAAVDRVVAAVDGVSGVTTRQVYTSKKEAQACADLGRKLDRATGRQQIPFAGESVQLTAQGRSMVVAAAKLVAACGSARVYVGGHTDSRTSNGSTLTLRRARTMIDLMRRTGAPKERLAPRGYGAQYPLSDGDGPAARQRNQRGSVTLVEG